MANSKILIVDDEPFNVDYLEQELEDLAYETVVAANGKEALEKVAAESPDLVLLDIMMPVMDGFEALSRLKANPLTRDIPVIVISAANDLKNVVKGIQLGAEDYLPKPFEPVLLRARISTCLEKKRLHDLQQLYLKSLERELEIGREIQQGFLPASLPEVEGWEIAALLKSAREVTGDFYDAFLLADGTLAIVIGDVCDKGVGAALYMTLFRSLIRAAATAGCFAGPDPVTLTSVERLNQVVTFTNHYIADTHADANMFATVFIGLIDPTSGSLLYINCGNEAPYVTRNGQILARLAPTGPAIGVMIDARFSVKEVELEKGDLLLAFTDGLPDSKNARDEFFGQDGITGALMFPGVPTPFALIDAIDHRMGEFIGQAPQYDDITILSLKRV